MEPFPLARERWRRGGQLGKGGYAVAGDRRRREGRHQHAEAVQHSDQDANNDDGLEAGHAAFPDRRPRVGLVLWIGCRRSCAAPGVPSSLAGKTSRPPRQAARSAVSMVMPPLTTRDTQVQSWAFVAFWASLKKTSR